MSTDSDVIARSMSEPALFGELFHRHAPRVHRYVARRAGERLADDVTSETFLIAFEKRDRFDLSNAEARPWLLGIATNLIHRHRISEARTLRSIERASHDIATDGGVELAGEAVDLREDMRRLARDLRRLPIADRDCLLLYAWEELSYVEIAIALQIPVGTVRSRLNRARRILRAAPTTKEDPHERAIYTADPA